MVVPLKLVKYNNPGSIIWELAGLRRKLHQVSHPRNTSDRKFPGGGGGRATERDTSPEPSGALRRSWYA